MTKHGIVLAGNASVMVDNIEVGERVRALDPATVEQLAQSFQHLGQLQPIGVKRQGLGKPLRLIYGLHRLAAKKKLRDTDPVHDHIPALIYPEDMPDWACELNEVAENLCRKELTPRERDAHTAIYAGLLKKHGSVADHKPGPKSEVDPNGSGQPTVTQKVAADLGIDDDTVRNRIRNASKLAATSNVNVAKPTPEKMSGEELVAVGNAALKAAEADKAKSAKRKPAKTNSAKAKPPTTTSATGAKPEQEQDREAARKYGEQLKAKRAAVEAQKPPTTHEDEAEKPCLCPACCCIEQLLRVIAVHANQLPREEWPSLLIKIQAAVDGLKIAMMKEVTPVIEASIT
jgi:hypothetical protein